MVTKASFFTQIANLIKILDETYKYSAINTTNLLDVIETAQQSYEGNHISATESAVASFRSNYSGILSSGTALLNSVILDLARQGYNSLSTSVVAALVDIAKGMNDGTETILNRSFTFAPIVSGGSNVGTGTVYRTTKGKWGHDLESGVGGTVRVNITSDRNTGRQSGAEQSVIFGDGQKPADQLDIGTASGTTADLSSKRISDSILANSSFDTFAGTGGGGTFAATPWTVSSQSNFDGDISNYYRTPASGTPASLKFLTNASIEQTFSTAGISFDTTRPAFLIVRFNRQIGLCDGTLTIRLGSQTESVVLAAQTGWNVITLGIGATNKGWYDVFKEDNSGNGVRIKIELSGRTTGTLLVDDVLLVQPQLYNGLYYMLVPGQTDFLIGDTFSFADTVAETGIIQKWIARLYSTSLPHTSGAPTYPDPT